MTLKDEIPFEDHGTGETVEREHFIPVRKRDLVERILSDSVLMPNPETGTAVETVFSLLENIYHFEYFEKLEDIKNIYYYYSPVGRIPEAVAEQKRLPIQKVVDKIDGLMTRANFRDIPFDEVDGLDEVHRIFKFKVKVPIEQYQAVHVYGRGARWTQFDKRRLFGLLPRKIDVRQYDDVVVVVALKDQGFYESYARGIKKLWRRPPFKPGSILIKHFRGTFHTDLKTLMPGVRLMLNAWDLVRVTIPALFGGITMLLRLIPAMVLILSTIAITELFEIITDPHSYAKLLDVFKGTMDSNTAQLIAAGTVVATFIGFVFTQLMKVQNYLLRYRTRLVDNVFFKNVSNYALVFDYLIGAAEEQECKESFLAYIFLLAEPGQTERELDFRIESWLKESFGEDIDFEADDALAKLKRLGLVAQDETDGSFEAVTPAEALRRLDQRWDTIFPFHTPAASADMKPAAPAARPDGKSEALMPGASHVA